MLRVSPSARHDIRFGPEGARCLLIEVSDEDASALRHPLHKTRFLNDPWLTRLAQRLDQMLSPAGQPQAAEDLVLEILAQVSRRGIGHRTGPPPRWLTQTRDRLADEWCRPPSAEELASTAGVHRVHLVRAFRDHFGCTLRAYVRRRRVAQAAGLLAQTDISLSRVALECGFSDQAHLTRVLRRAIGESPLSLRRRSRVGSHVTSVQYLRHWARLV
jgi:AraC-like DNA-binding protein